MRKWWIPGLLLFAASLSLVVLRSIMPSLVNRQFLFFILGGVLFWASSEISLEQWCRFRWWWYGGIVFLLMVTRLLGQVTRGAVSWIPIGPFHLEASQLAPAAIGLWLVYELSLHPPKTWGQFLKTAAIAAFPVVLVLAQPDLGSAIIISAAIAGAWIASRTPNKFFIGAALALIVLAVFSWQVLLKPYQKDRITSFISPHDKQDTAAYNATQSVIAVGSGQVWGRGIGQGIQSQLRFLPERQTDFIFASFAEELGMIGALSVIGLYGALTTIALWLSFRAEAEKARLFASLTATLLLAQVGINIGMNIGILPITGITLPFLSYGGSSILALCWHFGMLQSVLCHLSPRYHSHFR